MQGGAKGRSAGAAAASRREQPAVPVFATHPCAVVSATPLISAIVAVGLRSPCLTSCPCWSATRS